MHRKFYINRTKIKGGYQSRRKVVTHDFKSDLPLVYQLNVQHQLNIQAGVNQTKIKGGCQSDTKAHAQEVRGKYDLNRRP